MRAAPYAPGAHDAGSVPAGGLECRDLSQGTAQRVVTKLRWSRAPICGMLVENRQSRNLHDDVDHHSLTIAR